MSLIEVLLQWAGNHPELSLAALVVIFLSNVIFTLCLYWSIRTCTADIKQCFMFWVERRYTPDQAPQESHPKGWDLESILKILTVLDEIVALLKAYTEKPTEAIPPKVKHRRKKSRRGNKKKAKLSKAQKPAEDPKKPPAGGLSNVVAPSKLPKQKAPRIPRSSDGEPDYDEYAVLTELDLSDDDDPFFGRVKNVVGNKAPQHPKNTLHGRQQTPMKQSLQANKTSDPKKKK